MQLNLDLPAAEHYTLDGSLGSQRVTDNLINELVAQKEIAIDTETTGLVRWKDIPLFWSLAWGNRRLCMPANTLSLFDKAGLFSDPTRHWVLANAKYDAHMLANVGVNLQGKLVDTQVLHSLLYQDCDHDLKFMAGDVLGWKWRDFKDTFKPKNYGLSPDASYQDVMLYAYQNDTFKLTEYASNDAYGTLKILHKLRDEAQREATFSLYPDIYETMWDIFWKIEVPFTRVLYKCERRGVLIDTEYLATLAAPIRKRIDAIMRELVREVGYMINPKSPDQLKEYFFGKLKLTPVKFTKGGKKGIKSPSVDEDFLEFYAHKVPAAKLLLEHRLYVKILDTYVEGMLKRLDPLSRLHCDLKQDVTRCMPAGELVLTSRGYLAVENVRVGDLVISHTGVPRKVVETSLHQPVPIYRVELSNGLVLRTTGNHRYLTIEGWKPADSLSLQDQVFTHSDPEEWRAIKGWEDFTVSSWGRIFNTKTGRYLTQRPKGKWGHLKVELYRNGAQKRGVDRKSFSVHRLVLQAFGKGESGETRHLNGIAWDNTAQNLVRGTSLENRHDALRHGSLSQRRAGRSILTEEDVEEIRRLDRPGQPPSKSSKLSFEVATEIRRRSREGETQASLAATFGVTASAINAIVRERVWAKPAAQGPSATDLGARYGVSAGLIRAIWAGRRWKDEEHITGARASFRTAQVVSIKREEPEVTYGLTVEVDHSHVTGGIVTHNTGRLSARDPNMQNWPNADNDEFKLRGSVVAPPGSKMLVADYDMLEMKLLGAASGEEGMIAAFKAGKDIHMSNASLMYDAPYDDLVQAKKTDKKVKAGELEPSALTEYLHRCLLWRNDAKTIGFGLNYGMKAKKLAARLGCTEEEAQVKMDRYLERLPAVRQFFQDAVDRARKTGYSFTVLGRRRYLPQIISSDNFARYQAERQATNTEIQGSAADVAKMAMIACDEAKLDERYGCFMNLQIHDELTFECDEQGIGDLQSEYGAMAEVKEWMEHPFPTDLMVPLTASIGAGKSWLEAK